MLHATSIWISSLLAPAVVQAGTFDRELAVSAEGASEVAYVVKSSGTLHVWVDSAHIDPRVSIELDGRVLAADDDSGGGTTAWATAAVDAGAKLQLKVGAEAPGGAGAAVVHVRELPESDETRSTAAAVRKAVEDAIDLRNRKQQHEAARERLRFALALILNTPGSASSAQVIDASRRLMLDSYHLGDEETFGEALRFRDRALTALYPPECESVLESHMQLGETLADDGEEEEALAIVERTLASYERTRGPDHAKTIEARLGVAQVLSHAHRTAEAEVLARQAIEDLRRTNVTDVKRLGTAKYLHGTLLNDIGRQEEARDVLEEAVEALKAVFGEDDPFMTGALTNLGATLSGIGDHQEALAIFERVLAAQRRSRPADHVDLESTRFNIAVQMRALGRREEALAVFRELLPRAVEPRWPYSSATHLRTGLAVVLNELGRYGESAEILRPMIADPVWRIERDPEVEWRVNLELAGAEQALGDSRSALEHASRALALLEAHHPDDSTDTTEATTRVARLRLQTGDRAGAWELAERAALRTRTFFVSRVSTRSWRQAEALHYNWSRLVSDGLDVLPRCAAEAQRARADELAFLLVESSRSIGSIALRMAREIREPAALAEIERCRAAIAQCARDIPRTASQRNSEAKLAEALRKKEVEERALRSVIERAARSSSRLLELGARDVADALAPDEAAIGYWCYDDFSGRKYRVSNGERAFLAFVLRRGRAPVRVQLGPAEPITAACEAWREALKGGDAAAARACGEKLRKLVVAPLRDALGDARAWRVALDGELNLVPFDALPDGESLLGDRVRISSTPTLIELALPADATPRPTRLLALGGVDYDHEPEDPSQGFVRVASASTSALRGGLHREFAPLWETSDEVASIDKAFRERFPDGTVDLLEEREATKGALFERAPRATYLHVATHGFFAPESVKALGDGDPAANADVFESPETLVSVAGFSPMSLCGLALAGANIAPDDPRTDGGIATAEELAALDLSACELVVLSACDTNVGYLRAGQGIASFQKALHAAGARHVVTSLWKISDAATRELMVELYRALWSDGLAPTEALWRAKQKLRERRASSRDWAGWVLSGAR